MKLNFKKWTLIFATSALMVACGDDEASSSEGGSKKSSGDKKNINDVPDTRENLEATVGSYRFSVPSPVQMAKIIKSSNADYDENLINSSENAANYTTNYQQALNLGVYGADLGYLIMYDNTTDAMSYLAAVNTLTKELGISGAFDEAFVNKFTDGMDNLGNEDSMQMIVAEAYRSGNRYLQTEKSFDVIGLMLTGGYIESLHFATKVAKATNDQSVVNSIGNQKSSLTNLIGLLQDVNKTKKNDLIEELVSKMIRLQAQFQNIESSYTYVRSETNEAEKLTTIKSKTDVKISTEQIDEISSIVAEIRADIID